MTIRSLRSITGHSRIDGVVPGVRGQRSFPTSELRTLDPFVMLDHIGPEHLAEDFYIDGHFHPHRGFETLTIMFEGLMHHVDTAGFRETLATGSTQNMAAGSGIQHGGDMAADPDTHVFHELQLWVNMPAATKMRAPSISTAHAGDKPILDRGHYSIEVIVGTIDGQTSPLATTQPTTVARIQTSGPGLVSVDGIDPAWNAAIYSLRGTAQIADQPLNAYETATLENDGDSIELASTGPDADLLLITGKPIGEPVVMGGPYVMNTQHEIEQANADFAAGKFDNVTLASTS
jgi:redox-sensitive bicupin YhaK (pirin superfamily)